MLIKTATFLSSVVDYEKAPSPYLPEYAFIGRSNVGKSSLLNMITGQKKLAKTSSTPGKTQTINHFRINEKFYITDLPGYGYAKVSQEKRALFETFISDYLLKRTNLMCVCVLIDSRLPLQQIDAEFMKWLGEHEVPFIIIFTKTDKLTKTELQNNIDAFENSMLRYWEELPQTILTSSETGLGKKELLEFIGETNKLFKWEKKKSSPN